jgi:hypothetical protein
MGVGGVYVGTVVGHQAGEAQGIHRRNSLTLREACRFLIAIHQLNEEAGIKPDHHLSPFQSLPKRQGRRTPAESNAEAGCPQPSSVLALGTLRQLLQ